MPPNWIDHFTFPRALYTDIPEFAIGRTGWDNWLVWAATAAGARVIDVTRFCPVIHQRHDYSHAGGAATVFAGEEARRARDLVGHWSHYHGVFHARWLLTAGGAVVPARSLPYRLARPRRAVAHALRFTVPVRQRLVHRRLSRALRLGPSER
jgi:flavin-dependent dehydrogenase